MLGPFDKDYFSALLLLLPGFLSWQIMSYFGGTLNAGSDFQIIATSLSFSLFNFVAAMGIAALFGRRPSSVFNFSETGWRASPPFIVLLLCIALSSGASAAWVDRSGIIYQVIAPTSRVSHTRPWVSLWEECRPSWAKVSLGNGKSYIGFVSYFSDSDDNTELVLTRPHEFDEAGERSPLKAKRLLLFGKDISSIEVYPVGDDNPCATE